jgi:putative chitinase
MMILTDQLVKQIFPQCLEPAGWSQALNPALERYAINSKARLCSFLAQTGHESAQFNRLVEGLHYKTALRLMAVWPKRFPTEVSAAPYVSNAEKLANFVYANRLGNGDAASGDGFRFRGRGIIQITGRSNYAEAGTALGINLLADPDLLLTKNLAAMAAAWFWNSRGLNALADDMTDDNDLEDFTEITRRINGGSVGLKDRLLAFNQIDATLA